MSSSKVNDWIDIAQDDLETAEGCISFKKYLWAMVMCQQAIEKMLKAIYVKKTSEVPKKTHNLLILAKDVGLLTSLSEETVSLLEDLLIFYFGSRYPEESKKLKKKCTQKYAIETYEKTKEVYLWLKALL